MKKVMFMLIGVVMLAIGIVPAQAQTIDEIVRRDLGVETKSSKRSTVVHPKHKWNPSEKKRWNKNNNRKLYRHDNGKHKGWYKKKHVRRHPKK